MMRTGCCLSSLNGALTRAIPRPMRRQAASSCDGGPMSSTRQFGTAEYASSSGTDRCKSCQQPLFGAYFRVNGLLACESCTNKLQAQTPKDTHSLYVRGILFGVGGAIVGLI